MGSKAKEKEINKEPVLIVKPLEEVLHDSMMPYAEYVILDRAIPRVEDGLKPVQRRILYTMLELGVTPDKPYRKSARVVGDCLGKYHPHGDKSVYDAMVRMAQPFNIKNCLIDGHGNFGSIDGDTAAAMRYTEAKLTPLAMELLRDIEKNTVNFSLNFDDTLQEPEMLPGRFPNLLVNGASGIAVGLATNIPSHNLGEVIDGVIAFIDNNDIKLKQLMKIIKGPDFPTGGYCICQDELVKAYETGRGKILLRAKANIECDVNEKRNIVITELPYQVNKANLLEKILALKEDKKDLLAGIYDICDESDRSGMRAVIKVKRDYDARQILDVLFKYTDLQTTFGINMVAIANGKPQQLGLIDIIRYYVEYQREVVLRRTKFELEEAKERAHILEGLVIAVRNIDEVIKIIKGSQTPAEAKTKLRDRFKLSERQAQAILDMRLARLTSLEILKLEKELKEIKELIKYLQAIVDSKKRQFEVVKDELLAIKKEFKTERQTFIVDDIEKAEVSSFDDIPDIEEYAIVYNASDSIKKVKVKNFGLTSREISEKATINEIASNLIQSLSTDIILAFTNLGNCYKISPDELPECRWREKGELLSKILNCGENEKIVKMFPVQDEIKPGASLLFFTKNGYVKKTGFSEYDVGKTSFAAIKLKDKDEVINIEYDTENTSMVFVTSSGNILNADKSDLPIQGRVAGGVYGVSLSKGDFTVFAGQVDLEGEIVVATQNGLFKRVVISSVDVISRYRKGVRLIELKPEDRVVFSSYVKEPYSIAVINAEKEIFKVDTESISVESRTSKGKALKELKKGMAVEKIFVHKTEPEFVSKLTKEEEKSKVKGEK